MRIVFVSTMYGAAWGGSEELWSQAAVRLAQEGHEVSASVVWWPQLSPEVLRIEEQGVKLYTRRPPESKLSIRLWRKVKSRFLIEEEPEFQWLRMRKPDLVVVSQGGNIDGVEWMNFCGKGDLPMVSVMQCNVDGWYPDDAFSVEMAQAYRFAKKVFCVSQHNLNLLEDQIGEKLPQATVVWNPCSVLNVHAPPWPGEHGQWKLACVARLDPWYKGQDVLFRVLAQKQWRERPVQVNLFGSGSRRRILQVLAERLRLSNVRFCGHVPDVHSIWRDNHLLVLPSRCEGLPLALVEAMWCGRPAVVTDVGGNSELCVNEETGFVAHAPAPGALGDALERAWERREDWRSMGVKARRRAEQLVPRDPVGDFCSQLVTCAQGVAAKVKNNGHAHRA